MAINRTDLQEAVNHLARRLRAGEKTVFLLGAGCSMQYGLPSFGKLLTFLAADLNRPKYPPGFGWDKIRADIDESWLRNTPADRRQMIDQYMRRVSGKDCPAYRRLALLARSGHVEAFVNLNFDLLLEEALDAEEVPYKTSNAFTVRRQGELIVYKPHGSIGRISLSKGREDMILDLAKTGLFATEKERTAARRLMASADVVIVGYSGVDPKLADVLLPTNSKESGKRKLFLVNVEDPHQVFRYAAERYDPEYVLTTGSTATFENFLEELEAALAEPAAERVTTARQASAVIDEFDLMTRREEEAFKKCLQMAGDIRAGMNVAEKSPVGIVEHAREVFRTCLELVSAAGVCLSPPEKYLLRCSSVLHDLGYFFAFCGGRATENPGWLLLNRHGRMTVDLIQERFAEDRNLPDGLIPTSYEPARRRYNQKLWTGK